MRHKEHKTKLKKIKLNQFDQQQTTMNGWSMVNIYTEEKKQRWMDEWTKNTKHARGNLKWWRYHVSRYIVKIHNKYCTFRNLAIWAYTIFVVVAGRLFINYINRRLYFLFLRHLSFRFVFFFVCLCVSCFFSDLYLRLLACLFAGSRVIPWIMLTDASAKTRWLRHIFDDSKIILIKHRIRTYRNKKKTTTTCLKWIMCLFLNGVSTGLLVTDRFLSLFFSLPYIIMYYVEHVIWLSLPGPQKWKGWKLSNRQTIHSTWVQSDIE